MRHTQNSNDLLSFLTDGTHAEMLRRLCANQGAVAPQRIEYDTSSQAREQVHDKVTTSRARVRDQPALWLGGGCELTSMSRGPVPMHSQQSPGVVQNWSTLQCSKQNTEQCGYDHAPVTRGRMRAQFPLPHGPFMGHF